MPDTVQCPACNKTIAVKGIPKHTNGCPKWAEVVGVPPSEFNFNRHFKRGLYAEGAVEGGDFVVCALCPDHRAKRLADHLKCVHGLTVVQYRERHPEALTAARGPQRQREATVRERYGVANVSQDEGVRELLRERSRATEPEVVAKRKATNLRRYGHENPFGGEAVQEKIRETMVERHGAANPQQVPEIRERTLATTKERHGSEYAFTAPGFPEQFKATSQENWGADHPMQSEEGKKRWEEGTQEKLGVPNPLSDPDIWQKSYQTNLANHGGVHSQQCPEVLAKARATWMEKYGEDNPAKVEAVKIRIKEVWMGKYGVPFPPQSLWLNRELSFPNKLEQAVDALAPSHVVYAGDGSYWIQYKGASRARNPDFVVLKPDQVQAYRDGAKLNGLRTSAIIEVFGDYWHGPAKTGKSREEHKREVVGYYERCGVVCLVVWESEVKKHPKRVAGRILRFLKRWEAGAYLPG